jgi:hypothetical protein
MNEYIFSPNLTHIQVTSNSGFHKASIEILNGFTNIRLLARYQHALHSVLQLEVLLLD